MLVFGVMTALLASGYGVMFTVLDDFRRALERADLRDARYVAAVPLHAKLEVLVGIEAMRVDAELSHGDLR